MEYICKICGKPFKRYGYRRKNLYCSRECAAKGRTKLNSILYKCDYCGKEFWRKDDSEFSSHEHHFCSFNCSNNFQKRNKIKFVCKVCGNEFYRSKSWINQKKGLYCSLKCRNKDEDWKTKSCYMANQVQNKKKGLNKLELAGNLILDDLGIEYETQYLVNGKICVDVFIPSCNLIIQWDGSYWHGKDKKYELLEERIKKRVDLDKSQDKYLSECGYTVIRFWDTDVYSRKEYVYDTIKTAVQQITRTI